MPQTRAFIIRNDQAVILTFRGTEPTNLVQWATDASVRICGTTKPLSPDKAHSSLLLPLGLHCTRAQEAEKFPGHCGAFCLITWPAWRLSKHSMSLGRSAGLPIDMHVRIHTNLNMLNLLIPWIR